MVLSYLLNHPVSFTLSLALSRRSELQDGAIFGITAP